MPNDDQICVLNWRINILRKFRAHIMNTKTSLIETFFNFLLIQFSCHFPRILSWSAEFSHGKLHIAAILVPTRETISGRIFFIEMQTNFMENRLSSRKVSLGFLIWWFETESTGIEIGRKWRLHFEILRLIENAERSKVTSERFGLVKYILKLAPTLCNKVATFWKNHENFKYSSQES